MQVCVVGQGYVGLPLAIAAAEAGYVVYGVDNDKEKIESLAMGKSIVEDVSDQVVKHSISLNLYTPTTDYAVIAQSQVVLICVPTPLSEEHKPDLSVLISATKSVGINLKAGTLVIIESTIEPGTCRSVLLPILMHESGLNEVDFDLAYSPERIDPTNKKWTIKSTPKLVAGISEKALENAANFYGKFITSIIKCSSVEIAETAKLLENSFRLVNIAFIIEIAIFCKKIGIDVTEVISAASTKPYGFMAFYPSIGVGGHCIPVDPIYLASAAKKVGAPSKFIDLADQINFEAPEYFVNRASEKLGGLKGKKILIIGVSYKPNISDTRESPVKFLISSMRQKGAEVYWHDDLVKIWNGEKSVELSNQYDLAVLATPHDYIDLTKLGNVPVLNTRGSI
jgi:UDP-N-acetyl-D-glucosamine dehydrogenase